jgi:TatD DNase family protein
MNNIFDSHAHYDDEQFNPDRDELLTSLPGQGIAYVMNAASDLPSAEASIALAECHPFIWCAVGVHPHAAKDAPDDLEAQLTAMAKHPKVKAIGEIGLDYHYDFSPREKQLEVFRRQLILANELDLPVIIHDREAHADTMELLHELRPKGVVHCYSGSAEMAKELVKLGLYLGFTGAVTFKNARRAKEAVAVIPLDRLLIETDCPYMAPEPHRGRRCDSSLIPNTAAVMAAIKGIEPQALADIMCENACRLYGIAE